MTIEIALTLGILLVAVVLFTTEWIRVDVVAMLVLAGLALGGLVTAEEALSGFSNPAVVTVWAVFILGGGLSSTGVANVVGQAMLRVAGSGEVRLIVIIMLIAGLLSAFMNNVGVAALLLPVVINLARRTNRSASKLLMPLAMGSLLGGMMTLIGTPPNILAANALVDAGLAPFRMFDFAPMGIVIMLAGILFMVLIGRRLLPVRSQDQRYGEEGLGVASQAYDIQSRLGLITIPEGSALSGKTLAESRVGAALGLNVVSVIRRKKNELTPAADTVLKSGDQLLVTGQLDRLSELQGQQYLVFEDENLMAEQLISEEITMAEVMILRDASIINQTLQQLAFRQTYGVMVLAIWRNQVIFRTELENLPLAQQDVLLVQGRVSDLEKLHGLQDCVLTPATSRRTSQLNERLMTLRIPANSSLVGGSLAESRLAEALGLTVLGLTRDGQTRLMIPPSEVFQADDRLLVKGRAENLNSLYGLQELQVRSGEEPSLRDLESDRVSLVEAVLSPHTTLVGKTLRQIHFREKYGLSVLAILRDGQVHHTSLRDMALRFGDALLLHGPREKLNVLKDDRDFLLLTGELPDAPRIRKAPLAVLIMLAVVISVITGWLPIAIAAIAGSVLMVLTGCLTMADAYRFIEWRAVFLIAGMLPLGIAMDTSGAAQFLADSMIAAVGGFGLLALVAGLFALTSLASQIMPNPVVTVLMAPIALTTAADLSISPYTMMMVVAIAASASFLSPVGHPANVLIMGPGGYRFSDYVRVGLPLTIVILVLTLLVLPIFWPL